MEEEHLLGLLRLKLERGVNLVVRDKASKSSDPYIIFRLGKHEVKTEIKKKTTNPEWDEKLILPVEDPNIPLKLEVFDKDLCTRDDPMGHAEIDLKPLIEAGERDLSNVPDGFVIKTLVPSRENCFAEVSKIYWSERKVIQDMVIHLQNVESGEIEMKLTWGMIKQGHMISQ